ncbi:hypothetical protein ACVWZ3_005745 [Bradyrhizobium sp. i1.3.6]
MLGRVGMRCAFVAALILGTASFASAADDGVWSVSKSSGEVWLAANGAQPVSLTQEGTLRAGDTIRTGRNGRVLLVRGEESILISPNSVVGLPAEKKEGLSTTIIQQAGSILLEVEKRNVKHFEVETPYLAAVVKGTQFSVTVNASSTKVGVLRGQVEVSDFKSGQIAQVMPGQAATSFEHGKPGLSLSGAGTFNPIEHGKPRASTIERVPVPKSGLSAPRNAASGHAIHACARSDRQGDQGGRRAGAIASSGRRSGAQRRRAYLQFARRGQAERPQGYERARPRRRYNGARAQRERQHRDGDGVERYEGEHDDHGRQQLQRHGGYGEQQCTRGQCHVDVVKYDDDRCDYRWFDQRCVRRKLCERKQRDWRDQQRKQRHRQ